MLSSMHLSIYVSINEFFETDRGFLEEGVLTYVCLSPLELGTFLFCLHIYS